MDDGGMNTELHHELHGTEREKRELCAGTCGSGLWLLLLGPGWVKSPNLKISQRAAQAALRASPRAPTVHAKAAHDLLSSIVSLHLHLGEVFCLHFDLRFKPGRQVTTKEITIEDDSMSFYSLILLYNLNKNKWYKQSKAVEINHARRLLTDLHFVRC